METLTTEQIAWARSVGLTVERAAFLLSCPKFTRCNGHMKHERVTTLTPDKYIMKSGRNHYFRVHATHERKASVIKLSQDIGIARSQRDELAVKLGLVKPAHLTMPHIHVR